MPKKPFVPWGTKVGTPKGKRAWAEKWAKSKIVNLVKGWKARKKYRAVPWSTRKFHRDRAWFHTKYKVWTMTDSQRMAQNYRNLMSKRRRF